MSTFHIGKQIARARKQAGMTQVAVATALGVKKARMSRIEGCQHLSTRLLLDLCRIIGVDASDLLRTAETAE